MNSRLRIVVVALLAVQVCVTAYVQLHHQPGPTVYGQGSYERVNRAHPDWPVVEACRRLVPGDAGYAMVTDDSYMARFMRYHLFPRPRIELADGLSVGEAADQAREAGIAYVLVLRQGAAGNAGSADEKAQVLFVWKDRGVLLSVAGTQPAQSQPTPGTPPNAEAVSGESQSPGSGIVRIATYYAFLLAVGFAWVRVFTTGKGSFPWYERASLAALLGMGSGPVVMFLLAASGLTFSVPLIAGLQGGSAFAALALSARRRRPTAPPEENSAPGGALRIDLLTVVLAGVVLAQLLYTSGLCLARPVAHYDAISHWGLKAKSFYLRRDISFEGFQAHNYYPPLLPLAEAHFYLWMGRVADGPVKSLFVVFLLATVGLYAGFLRRTTLGPADRLILVAFLASAWSFIHESGIAYADLPLGCCYLGAVTFLVSWRANPREMRLLLGAGVMGAMTVLMKLEGAALVGISAAALAGTCLVTRGLRRGWVSALGRFLALPVVAGVAWGVFLMVRQISPSAEHMSTLDLSRLSQVLRIVAHPRWMGISYGTFWPMCALLLALGIRRRTGVAGGMLLFIVLANIVLMFAAYLTTGFEVSGQIAATLDRLVLHFFPVAACWAALQYERVLAGRSPHQGVSPAQD